MPGAACGLMFGAVLLIGGRLWQPQVAVAQAKQPAVPDVARAKRFEVVDAAGKLRVMLCVFADGTPVLSLWDAAEKERATLSLRTDSGPGLAVFDAAGKVRAGLGVSKDGSPSLELFDKNGNRRAVVGSTSLTTIKTEDATIRSESSLVPVDRDGKVMWRAP